MSGDLSTKQGLKRISWLPDREASDNGTLIAGQEYDDVFFAGGEILNVSLQNVSISGAISISGDVSVSGAITATGNITGANLSGTNTGDQTITLTGDVTGTGTGTFATTLATVNSNVGTFGDSANVSTVTVNAKGLVTAVSETPIAVPVDDTGFEVITGTTVQTAFASTDTALLNARSTGVRYGGDISDLGLGVVRITAGVGDILDNIIPSTPNYTMVSWSQTDLDLSAADNVYYIYVDDTGTVQSTIVAPSHAEYRTDIYLWRVSIRSGLVSGTTSIVQPLQQYGPQIWDIWRSLGSIKAGLVLSAASTNLTIATSAGEVYEAGVNFYNDALSPHELTIAARSPVTFRHVDQQGDQSADTTILDVANYDNAGTITAISGAATRATIFTVKEFVGSGNVRIFYGQTIYNTVEEAQQALQTGLYSPIFPASYDNATTLGWIIVQKGATNLADGVQVFITSNKFGLTGGAIATSGTGALLAVNNLSDLDNVATARTNLDVYSTGEVDAAILTTFAGTQVWTDVSGSRSSGVTYTNSTGRPIQLGLAVFNATSNPILQVDGVTAFRGTNSRQTCNVIVPSGSDYILTALGGGTNVIDLWAELR